jgi:hypothetical protein
VVVVVVGAVVLVVGAVVLVDPSGSGCWLEAGRVVVVPFDGRVVLVVLVVVVELVVVVVDDRSGWRVVDVVSTG